MTDELAQPTSTSSYRDHRLSEPQSNSPLGVADDADGGPEPILRVPEEITPLPAVDAAMPLLEHFATVVGRKRARYKIALLKTLQADGAGRWKIRRLQEIVHWLEPASVTAIIAELKAVDVLAHEQVTGFYRLTSTSRVITALLDAMTIPEVHPRSLIKFLNKAMALAQAGGAGDDVVLRQFRSAVAVLRGDWEDLTRLLDDHSDAALLEAAELVGIHVEDMRELLDEHQSFLAAHHSSTEHLDAEQEALELVARLGTMSAGVIAAISGRADERMRAGLRVERTDIREFLVSRGEEALAGLFEDLFRVPPYVVMVSAAVAFDAMAETSERVASTPPAMPSPISVDREVPQVELDAVELMRDEIGKLEEPVTVAEFTVRETWADSISRHSALLDAYSRWDELPHLDHEPVVEELDDGPVWRVSKTVVEAGS